MSDVAFADPMMEDNGLGDSIAIPLPDGAVVIDLNPQVDDDDAESRHDENLVRRMDDADLAKLAESLLEGIEADIQSRSQWEATRAAGLELLGLKLEQPRGDVGSSSSPLEGMSTVRHPLLLEAVLRAQATASGELLPASGPAKIRNDGKGTTQADAQAEALEKDFNAYLTTTAPEYYPDTRRTLFWSAFGGSHFKKVYHCPIRRRPVSEGVDAEDLIISDVATDLQNAPRVTHRIKMRPSLMRRMQIIGVYRDVPLGPPSPDNKTQTELKKESIEGFRTSQERPEDQPYTLYECYCEVVLDQFAPRQFKNKELPLPYVVTIDKDSREVLEVRRFWDEDDKECRRKRRFVKYPYVEALGIYGIGLVHILGNSTNALTAAWREALDAGMYANFPGGMIDKAASKQLTNEFRIPPGGMAPIETGGRDIRAIAMSLPYHDVTPGLLTLIDKIGEATKGLGATAEIQVGEGKQDAPVGTTIALIEQATKLEGAVHKGLHHAQSEEFDLLIDLFREDPEAFWRHNDECSQQWDKQSLLAALDNCKLVPVADPNESSHLHRVSKALAIKQLQAANPELYDSRAVDERVLRMIKVDDPETLFAKPKPAMPPPPDPRMIKAQADLIKAETGKVKLALDAKTADDKIRQKDAEIASNEKIATLDLAKELVIHHDNEQTKYREHGLAATKAAHDAFMDVHAATQPPQTPST